MKYKSLTLVISAIAIVPNVSFASPSVYSYAEKAGNYNPSLSNDPNKIYFVKISLLDNNSQLSNNFESAAQINYSICKIADASSCIEDLGTYPKAYIAKVFAKIDEQTGTFLSAAVNGAKNGLKHGQKRAVVGAIAGGVLATVATALTGGIGAIGWTTIVATGAAMGEATEIPGGAYDAEVERSQGQKIQPILEGKDASVNDIVEFATTLKAILKDGELPKGFQLNQ